MFLVILGYYEVLNTLRDCSVLPHARPFSQGNVEDKILIL